MMENSKNILDLPNEVLELIFNNLSYKEVAQIRPTCKLVNEVCCNLMSQPLRRFSKTLDTILDKFQRAVWFKKENASRLEYVNRLRKGAHSLLQLSAIVKTADAATYHLIRGGYFAPLSADFLGKVESAVKFATHKNPLVGKERMRIILSDFLKYFQENISTLATSRLTTSATFQIIIQTLESFSKENEIMKQTSFGLEYELSCVNPIIESDDGNIWISEVDVKTLLLNLVYMRLRATSALLQTSIDDYPADMLLTVDSSQPNIMLNSVRVKVWCEPEESANIDSESSRLLHIRPDKFTVEVFGRLMSLNQSSADDASGTTIQFIYTSTPLSSM